MRLDPASTPSTGAMLTPTWLGCPLCTLRLNSPEEIAASGTEIEKAQLPSEFNITWGSTLPLSYKMGETRSG